MLYANIRESVQKKKKYRYENIFAALIDIFLWPHNKVTQATLKFYYIVSITIVSSENRHSRIVEINNHTIFHNLLLHKVVHIL